MRYKKSYYDCIVIYDDRGIIREDEIREISINNLKFNSFELIENEIDIQAIEEYQTTYTERCIDREVRDYINKKILPAIKQLDNKINLQSN